jgi:hypothetical protein
MLNITNTVMCIGGNEMIELKAYAAVKKICVWSNFKQPT